MPTPKRFRHIKNYVYRNELVTLVSNISGFTKKDSNVFINAFLTALFVSFLKGKSLHLPRIGALTFHKRMIPNKSLKNLNGYEDDGKDKYYYHVTLKLRNSFKAKLRELHDLYDSGADVEIDLMGNIVEYCNTEEEDDIADCD